MAHGRYPTSNARASLFGPVVPRTRRRITWARLTVSTKETEKARSIARGSVHCANPTSQVYQCSMTAARSGLWLHLHVVNIVHRLRTQVLVLLLPPRGRRRRRLRFLCLQDLHNLYVALSVRRFRCAQNNGYPPACDISSKPLMLRFIVSQRL